MIPKTIMAQRLLFIYNPHSGQGKIKAHLSDIIDIMIKAGFEVTVYVTQAKSDAVGRVAESAAQFDRIVVSGGDGTLDEAVTGLMQAGVKMPIGYIPSGSTNDFASSVGISTDMTAAAKVAVGDTVFPCDAGGFNEDYFVYVAAFGLFTEASYATSQEMKNMLGHAAYILEGVKQLAEIPAYRMQVEHDGNVIYGEFVYGMVTNSISIGGIKGLIAEDVGLRDGLFEVTLIKMPRNPIELSEILAFFTNFNRDTELVYSFQTKKVRFTSEQQVPWTLDGEFGGEHEIVTIENLPEAMGILI